MNVLDKINKLKLDNKVLDLMPEDILTSEEVFSYIDKYLFGKEGVQKIELISNPFYIIISKGVTCIKQIERLFDIYGEHDFNLIPVDLMTPLGITKSKFSISPLYTSKNYGKTWITTHEFFYNRVG